MVPVIGRKIEERQQRFAILDQAIDCLLVFRRVFFGEGRRGGLRRRSIRSRSKIGFAVCRCFGGAVLSPSRIADDRNQRSQRAIILFTNTVSRLNSYAKKPMNGEPTR
jgi:hypothetical protein